MAKHRKTNLLRESGYPIPLREETEWFKEQVLSWAAQHGRDFPWRHTADEYRVAVTEILLQQTTASAVAALYEEFFDRFTSWQMLHAAPSGDLRGTIARLGLGDQRTRRLKELAAWVAGHDWHLPTTREELEDVPGVGQYVASAVLTICHGAPEPLLDVNMARVLERFFGVRELADIRDDPWLQHTSRRIAATPTTGWAVLDFAAAICGGRLQKCKFCPLSARCLSVQVPRPDQRTKNP